MDYLNKQKWLKEFKKPDWYNTLKEDYVHLYKLIPSLPPSEQAIIREELYSFVEECLRNHKITLAKEGVNQDKERKAIDTVVIHHTHHAQGMSKERLSAIHFIRLYSGYQTNAGWKDGEGVWSNHFNEKGEQVFYSYHWFVHQDGSYERLLKDTEIGWHAGNWDVNCRSLAICIDDNLDTKEPNEKVIASIVEILKNHYPHISGDHIIGHREVNPKTTCPGNFFLDGWKTTLVGLI